MKTKYKNNIFLDVLNGEKNYRPPVWMMRQAGRYLPDYIKLKSKYSFFERIKNPNLVAEITVMPIEQIGMDVAILFSDIMVVPMAMGFDIEIIEGIGPVVKNPFEIEEHLNIINNDNVIYNLDYVFKGVLATKEKLNNNVPLIGFAGSPWTIFCYLVEGKGSKSFDKAKKFCFQNPKLALSLLDKITDATILYLNEKQKYGVDAIQIFDSWGGMLSKDDYMTFSFPFIKKIIDNLNDIPKIIFPKGCWFVLREFSELKINALGIDWTISPTYARNNTKKGTVLQGNLDPTFLFSPKENIKQKVLQIIKEFGYENLILNLGHGILPNTPVENAKCFVDTVKNFNS